MIELVSIEPTSRIAKIRFSSSQGVEEILISEYTFTMLFGKWDEKRLGTMTDQQRRLIAIAKKELKNPVEWFINAANEYERNRATTTSAKGKAD